MGVSHHQFGGVNSQIINLCTETSFETFIWLQFLLSQPYAQVQRSTLTIVCVDIPKMSPFEGGVYSTPKCYISCNIKICIGRNRPLHFCIRLTHDESLQYVGLKCKYIAFFYDTRVYSPLYMLQYWGYWKKQW